MSEPAAPPDHLGHRKRLRGRLLQAGGGALADYELLEMLLFAASARADTKPLAKALLRRFGSFGAVLAAEPARLKEVEGVGEAAVAALKVVQESARRLLLEEVSEQPVLSSWDKLLAYCRAQLAHETVENFHVLFLDRKNRLIADERQQRGTVDHTPAYPREVVKRALDLGASALILVHNHPSGDPTPSTADVTLTRDIKLVAEKLGIALHDHLVIGRAGHSSLRSLGLI